MRATGLPPGPPLPAIAQTIGFWTRPTAGLDRLRARYGQRFTTRLIGQPPFVVLADPEDAKAVLTAPPDVLHPGEGAAILEPTVGPHSVILLDEAPHLEQRKLMLPAFHGERMARLTGLMETLTDRELERWPSGEPVELHPRLQRLTLEIILIPALQVSVAGRGPFARFARLRAGADRHLFELISERRALDPTERDDVLAMLLKATHSDGSPMGDEEIRDELLTALVAGHETTASSLAFAFA